LLQGDSQHLNEVQKKYTHRENTPAATGNERGAKTLQRRATSKRERVRRRLLLLLLILRCEPFVSVQTGKFTARSYYVPRPRHYSIIHQWSNSISPAAHFIGHNFSYWVYPTVNSRTVFSLQLKKDHPSANLIVHLSQILRSAF
jgi:hypothetical protein